MKLFQIFALVVTIGYLTGSASASPELSVDQPVFNFGAITQGKKVHHVFSVKNIGDEPLNIRKVTAACGCTAANSSSPVIQPGKTGEIKTTFDSANFTGKISKTIAVETNDPRHPTITLTIAGTISEEIQLSPRQLSLGPIKIGTTKESVITVMNRGEKSLQLLSVKSQLPQIKAEIRKNLLKPGESTTIEVKVTPKAEDRVLSGYLFISTDNPLKNELIVPIYASPVK